MAIVHGINAVVHPCTVVGCTFKAKQSGHLKFHQSNVHGLNVVWKVCGYEDCDYKTKQGGRQLKKHASRHGIVLETKKRGETYEGWKAKTARTIQNKLKAQAKVQERIDKRKGL